MVGYVYFSSSLLINGKIDIVDYIEVNDSNKKIVGHSSDNSPEQIVFDGGSSYIILSEDTINKNIGDTIDLTGLVDCSDYFIKGKEYYYQQQVKTANETIASLQNNLITYGQAIDTIMLDIIPSLDTTSSSTTTV